MLWFSRKQEPIVRMLNEYKCCSYIHSLKGVSMLYNQKNTVLLYPWHQA